MEGQPGGCDAPDRRGDRGAAPRARLLADAAAPRHRPAPARARRALDGDGAAGGPDGRLPAGEPRDRLQHAHAAAGSGRGDGAAGPGWRGALRREPGSPPALPVHALRAARGRPAGVVPGDRPGVRRAALPRRALPDRGRGPLRQLRRDPGDLANSFPNVVLTLEARQGSPEGLRSEPERSDLGPPTISGGPMQLEPVGSETRVDQVFEQLRSQILSGAIPPGSRLPTERDLADTLGVNRGSVREALKRLEFLELVEVRHGLGTFVQELSGSSALQVVEAILRDPAVVTRELLEQLLQFRRHITLQVVDLAARN